MTDGETAVPAWRYDPVPRDVRVGDHVETLTTTEGRAFEYLLERIGDVVSRRELERDVWGLAEGVRTHTVSVTVRTLRAKLGPHGKAILQTVYGTGWRLLEPTATRAHSSLPRFGKPLFERPADLDAIQQRFDDGWRVVTLAGPGGVGKTRLAVAYAEASGGTAVFVPLGGVRTPAELTRAFLTASAMRGDSLDAVLRAAEGQRWLFVLDEADTAIEPLRTVLPQLGAHRVLLTVGRPLGLEVEACHTVRGLHGEAGRAFTHLQLRSSPWGHRADDATVDALVECLDGNALGLELVAGHPSPPHVQLESLRQGGLPGAALERSLRDAYEDLAPETRDVLRHLALCEGRLRLEVLLDWLGSGADERLRDLAARSLLQPDEGGWRLLRTMRSFVLAEDADWDALRDSWQAWLVRRAGGAEEALYQRPDTELDALTALVPDLFQALRHVDLEHLPTLLWALCLVSYLRGPWSIQNDATLVAVERAPTLPLVLVLKAYSGRRVDREAFLQGLDSAGPEDQLRALFLFSYNWLPRTIDLGARSLPEVDTPLARLQLSRLQLPFEPDLDEAVARILTQASRYPLVRLMVRYVQARLLTLRGQLLPAHRLWQQLVEELGPTRLGGMHLFAVYGMADALLELDRDQAAELYREAAELGVEYGYGGTWVIGRVGLWLALLDQWDDARPFLEQGARSITRNTSMACDALLLAARVREGSPMSIGIARTLDLTEVEGVLGEGTPLRDVVRHVLDGELARHDGTTHEVPSTTVALRVWGRSLANRTA